MASRTIPPPGSGADRWFGVKTQIHSKLLNSLTPDQLKTLTKEGVREQIGSVVERLIADDQLPMTVAERERLIEEVLDEVFGLGPLEPLLKDPTISDILVNGFDNVYVERGGKLVETNVRFKDQAHVRMIIDRIVSNIGRRIDDSSPIVDARLADGSRVCAVIPPLSLIGPVLSIRRFGKKLLSTEDLLKNETAHHRHARFSERLRGGAAQHRDLRRFRLRQDDHAEYALPLHSRRRARGHHRRYGRAADAAAARGAPGDAAHEHRRRGRHHAARPGDQRPAYAPRPHHRRRVPRRRSVST